MPGNFTSPDGDLSSIFVDDYAMIDQYAKTGSLWLWGDNRYYGMLGNGDLTQRSSPVQTVAAGTNWKSCVTTRHHSVGIKTDGTLWSWGRGQWGALGDDTTTNRSSPVQTISGGTNWRLAACGRYHTSAIKTDGTLWSWGYNAQGQLGTNNTTHRSSPVQTVAGGNNWKSVAASGGGFNTCAIKTDNTLWLWGHNNYGQLGNNSSGTNQSSPVQTVSGGTNWKQVSCGRTFTAAIKMDGTLWLWGKGLEGQLGTNNTNNQSSPVQTVAAGTNWKLVACGTYYTAAIKTDGTLWMWGTNTQGNLGTGVTEEQSSPVQTVAAGTNWKLVSAGSYVTAAIKTDGTLWLWGKNNYGQLGINNITNKNSPVQTVAAGTNWKTVNVGYEVVGAIYNYDAGNLYPSA